MGTTEGNRSGRTFGLRPCGYYYTSVPSLAGPHSDPPPRLGQGVPGRRGVTGTLLDSMGC